MYVTGRGTDGPGTIFPAIIEVARANPESNYDVVLFATNEASANLCCRYLAKMSLLHEDLRATLTTRVVIGMSRERIEQVVSESGETHLASIVAVPDHAHYDIIDRCADIGAHVLTVKPFVENLRQARALIAKFQKKGLLGCVEFHKRKDMSNIVAKDLFESGRLGALNSVCVNYSQRLSIPTKIFKKWAEETNIFQYLAVHYVDQICFVTGAIPRRAIAFGVKNKLVDIGINGYDEIHAIIEWEKESRFFLSNIRCSWIDSDLTSAMSDQSISYHGTEASLSLNQKDRGIQFVDRHVGVQDLNPYFSITTSSGKGDRNYAGYGIDSVVKFFEDVTGVCLAGSLDVISEGETPTFSECLPSVAVVEAVNKSLRINSNWVEIENARSDVAG